MSKGPVRRIRLRAIVAYPAVSVALVAAVALALTPFGPAQGMALAATATPTETTTASATPTTTTAATATATATATPSVTTTAAPTPSPSSGVAAPVGHHVLARIEGPQLQANYLPVDVSVPDAEPFQRFRVRFQLHNAGATPITVTPRLEYRTGTSSSFTVVPEKPLDGIPFHMAREWVPSLGLGGGTMQGPLGEDIAVADLRIATEVGLAVNGHHSMGANPDQPVTLPSASYTEEEFTVVLSIDAKYLTGYELRITDLGTPLPGMGPAMIRLSGPPAVRLSPDQRHGVAVVDPTPIPSTAGGAFPAIFAASSSAASSVPAASATTLPDTMRYPLVAGTPTATIDPLDQIHGPYSMTTDKCGICHRTHTAKASNLLAKGSQNSGSQSILCLACHNGTGAEPDVVAQYGLVRHVNDRDKRDYYSHDAVDATPVTQHTQSQLNEFGSVDGVATPPLNRHSECSDCHNPHKATSTAIAGQNPDSTQTTTGWTVSGRLTGVSGVAVENGAAGSPPTYAFLSGVETDLVTANLVTREYQVCFKCHSGFTALTSNVDVSKTPSKYALDKAVEFNPANPSFHPVEAVGRNNTAAMDASLHGASDYKLWDFNVGSTIRCLNCHASSATPGTPLPQPGSVLAPHTSSNRGILIRNYRDRSLKPGVDVVVDGVTVDKAAYDAGDFALCYVCHGQAPFGPPESTIPAAAASQTNFEYHSKHVTDLENQGPPGTDIDTEGDGGGNAICAECHFRLHSTTNKVGAQILTGDPDTGSRLVNFAPNVQPFVPAGATSGTISWTSTGTGGGSCTLRCHAVDHNNVSYGAP